ncbi:hypothetical protein [Streptomyces sp. CBMA152]|uniref:hypothetical protein n=1 Tax=Streptomyces sp. CBMA152 TaxID=1896312 RepID=UPI001660220B|nr:hypothetical protein [Streptomyces sp. CBMA152]MBD0743529.1 hypothetical protein [Streptomyces sp. CBMA152]
MSLDDRRREALARLANRRPAPRLRETRPSGDLPEDLDAAETYLAQREALCADFLEPITKET